MMTKLDLLALSDRIKAVNELAVSKGYTSVTGSAGVRSMILNSHSFTEWYLAQVMRYLADDLGGERPDFLKYIPEGFGYYLFPRENMNVDIEPWDCLIVFGKKGRNLTTTVGWELMEKDNPAFMKHMMMRAVEALLNTLKKGGN